MQIFWKLIPPFFEPSCTHNNSQLPFNKMLWLFQKNFLSQTCIFMFCFIVFFFRRIPFTFISQPTIRFVSSFFFCPSCICFSSNHCGNPLAAMRLLWGQTLCFVPTLVIGCNVWFKLDYKAKTWPLTPVCFMLWARAALKFTATAADGS